MKRRNLIYPFYLGIDLHRQKSYAVLMDQQGNLVDEREIANSEVEDYLKEVVPQYIVVALETTRIWLFMYDLLLHQVVRVELAHPKQLKAISAAAGKTAQIDTRVLAYLARLGYLPVDYVRRQKSGIYER